ncbi:hypothetical protein K435DRAFT_867289 [Dendrothele bispora CBS 962.96]|uniref:Myb-like domain-containing protein n=1 Tax=Dendrothele bispora (strain CBS 962.96) TaxID=1314807 RepID=A0A4S8LES9_DENBC|nr:hypothetical protein K435DRAFT_867289 [Dendrothele bispora CBS 962.96]
MAGSRSRSSKKSATSRKQASSHGIRRSKRVWGHRAPSPESQGTVTHSRSASPTWDCENDDLPTQNPSDSEDQADSNHDFGSNDQQDEDVTPGGDVEAQTGESDDEDNEQDSHQRVNARSPNWKAWQDRYLIQMVDKLRLFDITRSEQRGAWDELSSALRVKSSQKGPKSTVDRTGQACRARFNLLVKFHEQEQTRSKQITGTNEEVDEHIQLLDGLVKQYRESKVANKGVNQQKLDLEKQAGLEIRDAAMQGMVPRENLTDVTEGSDASVRERQGHRKRRRSLSDTEDKENSPLKKARQQKFDEVLAKHNAEDESRLREACECKEKHHQETIEVQRLMVDTLQNLNAVISWLTE